MINGDGDPIATTSSKGYEITRRFEKKNKAARILTREQIIHKCNNDKGLADGNMKRDSNNFES
eukprot:3123069-Pyramimonas_sp.AAC.1